MEDLIIKETIQTPAVHMDGDNGVFSFSGKSYPDNVHVFYKQIFDYIESYGSHPCDKTVLEFRWLYYNTATSKIIVRLIMELEGSDTDLRVKWYCPKEVIVIREKGEEIGELLGVNMEVLAV